jgi:hypothetical protein
MQRTTRRLVPRFTEELEEARRNADPIARAYQLLADLEDITGPLDELDEFRQIIRNLDRRPSLRQPVPTR